jgi:hypothetical protein
MLGRDLFNAFSRSYDPPYWIIEDLLEAGLDSVRTDLASALEAVPSVAISHMDPDARAQSEVLFRTKDPELRARLYLVSRDAALSIERARLAEITSGLRQTTPPPYDHRALVGIVADDEGLVPLGAFKLEGDALCVNNHAFFMVPPVPGSNASYWLLQHLRRKGLIESVRVRLDPLLHGPAEVLSGRFYRMDVYGRPLDWNRIRKLQSPDHGRWVAGKMSRRFLSTEYAWMPQSNEVHFVCEELPMVVEVSERGARYLHAVYDKGGHCVTHLDGAVRVYTAEELAVRATSHVRNTGKIGTRVKVFRTDRAIDPDLMADLIQAFFVWNYDVARYFGATVPDDF